MAGLRDPQNKLRVKKPTRFVASDEILVKNLRPLWCYGRHQHSQLEGTYKGQNKTHIARIWPWELASRIASGVSAVVRKVQKEKLHSAFITAYPVERPRTSAARNAAREASGTSSSSDEDTDADTDDDDSLVEELQEEEMEGPEVTPFPFKRELPRVKYTCPACRAGKPEHAEDHTEDPTNCKYPPCRACKHRRHMDHKDHTCREGECKVAGIPRILWRCPGCQ